jgi:hypothetical protein
MNNISKFVVEKNGHVNLLDELQKLSGSELNSLMLELFRNRIKKISPAGLLKLSEKNRFTIPSSVDTIAFKELEIKCLKLASGRNFSIITLSPLAPLGTCSVIGLVDQNNVVSTVRGVEVVSDATNVFALLIAKEFKNKNNTSAIRYAAVHRHVRGQAFSNPAFSAHFGIFCLATGGLDTGNFCFEIEHLLEHMQIHLTLLSNEFAKEKLFVRIYLKDGNENFYNKLRSVMKIFDDQVKIKIEKEMNAGAYYKLTQFKFFLEHNGDEINLSDGGFVDWTQKLISNNKHRLIISGVGTELIHKLRRNIR